MWFYEKSLLFVASANGAFISYDDWHIKKSVQKNNFNILSQYVITWFNF